MDDYVSGDVMIRLRKSTAAVSAVLVVVVAGSSCDGDSTGPEARDISGDWTLTATYNSAQLQTTCTLDGLLSLDQSGSTFTGLVTGSLLTCSGPGGTTSSNADGPITGGQISGNTASYSDGECNYTGTISGSPANRVAGDVDCDVSIEGTTYPFTGTWQLSR